MAARFKVDENLPREAQALLLNAGHDAQTVHDERLVGHSDAKILDVCLKKIESWLLWISTSPISDSTCP